jgi:hypothetical protein
MSRTFVVLLAASSWAADSLPSPQQVLDRYIQATGGAAAHRRIQTEIVESRLKLSGVDTGEATMRSFTARGGLRYQSVEWKSESQEQGVRNGVAWEISRLGGARLKSGNEKETAIRDADLMRDVEWRSHYPKAETIGLSETGGLPCFEVRLTPQAGPPETRCYSRTTGFLLRTRTLAFDGPRMVPAEITYSDYRSVGPLIIAMRSRAKYGERIIDAQIEKISYDVPIETSAFRLPSEVAELVALSRSGKALPNAALLIDRHIEKTGGVRAHQRARTQTMRGTMEIVHQGIVAQMVRYTGEGRESYQVLDVPGLGLLEEGNNGLIYWERSALMGPKVKQVLEQPTRVPNDAVLLTEWRSYYNKVETVAVENVDGKVCYKVIATPHIPALKTQARWYDRETGLLVRTSFEAPSENGNAVSDLYFRDYRKVGDLLAPFEIETRTGGQVLRVKAETIEVNAPIPEEAFAVPQEILELVARRIDQDKGRNP